MKRFELLNSKNKIRDSSNGILNEGLHSQLWGVVLSAMSQMGSQWSFGVAVNESLLLNVVIPDDHPYLENLKTQSDQFIGRFIIDGSLTN